MPSILIVDDEVENLKALQRYLQDQNPAWKIQTVRGESDLQTVLKDFHPDVVISDLVMATEQSGVQVLREVKEKDPLVMVILITAFEKKLNRYRAFELGAFDCVQKNMPGIVAAQEILFKTQAALKFRELALSQIEQEKRLSVLRRYFDPQVFGTIEQTPELLSVRSATLTICFWDIRGFSRLCEILKAHPTLISGFLREYFRLAAEVIFENGGVLDKFIGDGVMGLFGALGQKDEGGREEAVRAVSAAIALRTRFDALVPAWLDQWALYAPQKIDIGLGCGIHTGEALVGNTGTEIREQFTALGPHVNFAQRLEARAGKAEIIISASTEGRVRGQFELKDAGTISDVKNIAGEFPIFSVEGPLKTAPKS